MKKFYLVRHAKSSWSDATLLDIERPLNDRGKRDAPFMAQKLSNIDSDIELFVSSPAKRAKKTAGTFINTAFEETRLQLDNHLYHASTNDILDVIRGIDNSVRVAAVFGHNPGFTSLANYFAVDYIDNVPTCGVVGVEYGGDNWAEINKDNCKLTHFLFPKMYSQ